MNKHCVQDQVDCHVIFKNLLWNNCSSCSFLKLDASVSQVMAEKADFICSVVIIVCRDAAPLSCLLFQSLLGLEMTCPLRPRGGSRLIQITLCASLTFFFASYAFIVSSSSSQATFPLGEIFYSDFIDYQSAPVYLNIDCSFLTLFSSDAQNFLPLLYFTPAESPSIPSSIPCHRVLGKMQFS